MFSFKNIYSENINTAASCFITGPTKCGKSWFIRENLKRFQKSSNRPQVYHYDLREQKVLSFSMFLHSFESMLIENIVKYNKSDPVISP